MKRYLYNYQTIVTFSEAVSRHTVMLRCQPAVNDFQTIEQEHVVASPDYVLSTGTDAFGNRILFGSARKPQTVFAYVSTGIVATENIFAEAMRRKHLSLPPAVATDRYKRGDEGCGSDRARNEAIGEG